MLFENLRPYLAEEKYPYEFGTIRGFALALISGDYTPMLEEFRMHSAGQGVNSKASYISAINELQDTPGLLESLGNQIPFPALVSEQGQTRIEVQNISVAEALERINRFS